MASGGKRLHERERELERLDDAVRAVAGGEGQLVVVEGPAGIGKSGLLAVNRERARAAGLAVLTARGGELERDFAFGVVRQLFERAALDPDREGVLAGAAANAAPAIGLAPPAGADAPADDPSFGVMHGLYWLAANLAEAGPLLLEVDDVHWADAPSLRFLLYLANRLEGMPLLLVTAARTAEPGAEQELVVALGGVPGATVITPRALSERGSAAVVADDLGEADPAFVAACHRSSAGNPFLLHELVTALRTDGVAPTREAAARVQDLGPHSVSRAVLLRIGRLPDAAAALARAVAVLGAQAELRLAAELGRLTTGEAENAADALAAAAILSDQRPLAFEHPVIRESIYADLGPGTRAELHGRAARILADAGGAPDEVALHLLATEPGGQAWVVDALREAARGARARGAADAAQRLLRRALAEPPAEDQEAAVLGELGAAEWLAAEDPLAAIEHLREAADRTEDPDERAGARIAQARAVFSTGNTAAAVDILQAAIDEAAGANDEARFRLEAELGSVGLLNAPSVGWVGKRTEQFGALPGDTPAELLLLTNLSTWHWLGGTAQEAAAVATRALGDGRLLASETADSIAFLQAVWVLAYADEHEQAWAAIRPALEQSRERGSVFAIVCCWTIRAVIARRGGDIRECEASALAGMELPGLPPFAQPTIASHLVLALVEQGELEEAERAVEQTWVGPLLPNLVQMNVAFFARGMLRAAQGRHAEALADFVELGRRDEETLVGNPGLPWRLEAARAQLALGDREAAARLVADHAELALRWGTNSAIGVLRHAEGLVADGARAPELLEAACALLADSPARLDHARALVDLGAALRREGRRTAAQERLREGLELARACGATALAERAHEELRTAGARPRRLQFSGVEALTASERRVAQLAAEGMSNAQIAQELFVTGKTVENHLGRAYTKLGVGGRRELPAALATAGTPS